ncbi:uncharacterized protein PAC_04647 [Phialocephala subalpina]|uniref:Uncharacterized protein n=1 Tax=Phialocephala subalpina TaxID=576137 RepID=A0A1L7WPR5_9HELO|nr:uncharacterized protein PAC_04647 [Phialocephala subalpina]
MDPAPQRYLPDRLIYAWTEDEEACPKKTNTTQLVAQDEDGNTTFTQVLPVHATLTTTASIVRHETTPTKGLAYPRCGAAHGNILAQPVEHTIENAVQATALHTDTELVKAIAKAIPHDKGFSRIIKHISGNGFGLSLSLMNPD